MADSDQPFDIPAGKFPLVASYIGVDYGWTAAARSFHSRSLQVDICVENIQVYAHVADIESGALTVAEGVKYAEFRVEKGLYPTLYYSEYLDSEVQAAMGAAGIHSFGIWRANWNDIEDLHPNDLAHQFADAAMVGAHYDLSIVRDYWPGLDSLPPPPAAGGAGGAIENWAGLQVKVSADIPAFSSELGVLASSVTSLG